MEKITRSRPQEIRTVDGNGVAVYIDNTSNKAMIKDVKGNIALLSDFLSGSSDQDNIDIFRNYVVSGRLSPSLLSQINNGLPFEITETKSLWIEELASVPAPNDSYFTSVVRIYKLLNLGKGTYGAGGNKTVQFQDLKLISSEGMIIEDIENLETTSVLYIPTTGEMTIAQFVNQSDPPYIVKPKTEGETIFKVGLGPNYTSYWFIGDSGTYGSGYDPAAELDFQELSEIRTFGVQPGQNVSLLENDADYQRGSDLPDDFFISTTIDGSYLTYETNEFRTIDLQPFIPLTTIFNTNEIVRNGNDLFVLANFTEDIAQPSFIIALYGCKIINNVLFVRDFNTASIALSSIHGFTYHRGFLFLSNRTGGNVSTTVGKINPYDLTDQILTKLPDTAEYWGSTTDIIGYKNKLYIVASIAYQTDNTKVIEIDENLKNYKVAFIVPYELNYGSAPAWPFAIYNDEMYLVLYGNALRLSIKVFDLKGNFKRKNTYTGFSLPTGASYGAAAHWLTVFNCKLIMTTVYKNYLCRIDCQTLALEERIALPIFVTDDNSIKNDGYVYLNGELSPYALTILPKLLKVKYNNFTDVQVLKEDYNNGKGSYGSINNFIYKEALNNNINSLTPYQVSFPYSGSSVFAVPANAVITAAYYNSGFLAATNYSITGNVITVTTPLETGDTITFTGVLTV